MAKLATLICIIAAVAVVYYFYDDGGYIFFSRSEIISVIVRNTTVQAETARTLAEKKRGLSEHETLRLNDGMLFIYNEPGFYSFWMKDMKFPIDIIWIGENKTVVGITKNIAPETFPETFQPPSPAQYILEVNAGWSDRNLIRVGDTATF